MSFEYKIELSPASQRQLKKLPKQLQQTIIQKLDSLKTYPLPLGVNCQL